MAIMEQTRNGRVVRKHRSLVARLSVVALAVLITGAGLAAHGSGSASASALNATGGAYKLAPALMGGGASQPGANPNATLTMNLVNEVTTADPQVESFVNEIGISSKIFAPLLAVNQHLQVAANAATSLNVSPDGRTYTFTIRPGMTYSDGQPVTAQDYAFAIKRACSPVVAGNYSNILFDVVGCQAWRTADTSKVSKSKLREMEQTVSNAIKALDAHTLRIQLLKPAGYFPYVMATWVTYPSRPDLVQAGGVNWWKNPKYYIGNGPFKVVSWKPRQQWVLARNDNYFRGKPGIARLVYKEITSRQTELLAYRQGQFDVATVDSTLLPQVLSNPTLKQQLRRQIGANTFYMGFNNADKPFNNLKVRQALAYALNRQQYINQVANGAGKPAGTFLYPGIAGYQTTFQQTYAPGKAKSLLAQAGYPNGRGFPTEQLRYNNTDPAAKQRATFWSQQLKQILNVNIQPTPTDPAQLQTLLSKRSPQLKIYLLGWIQDYPHPQDWLSLVFGNNSSLAPHGWNDPHFNDLVNRADQLPIQEATPLYQQADAYLARMAPVAFYVHSEDLVVIKPDVKGYVRYPTSPFESTYQPEKIYKTKP
jgi:oligopeptide transport system substrate-binding protein